MNKNMASQLEIQIAYDGKEDGMSYYTRERQEGLIFKLEM